MSTDAITSASDSAKRNLANARSNYNNPIKNPSLTWDGSGYSQAGLLGLTNILGQMAPVALKNNNVLSNNTATQNVNAVSNYKDYDNSAILDSHINTSSSNAENSFVAKMTTESVKQPSAKTLHGITGDNFISILVEIAEQINKLYASYSSQITLMSSIPTEFSMSLWALMSKISVAVVATQQEKVDKQIQDARDAAESAGKCAFWGGIGEIFVAAALIAISIAAIVAIPFSGGLTAAVAFATITATVGLVTGIVMGVDGGVKANAGHELYTNAQSTNDIQELLNSWLPQLQFGVYTIAGKGAGDFQRWFTIASAVLTIGASTGEILAGQALAKVTAEVTEVAVEGAVTAAAKAAQTTLQKIVSGLTSISKGFAYFNSIVSITGMIASAIDPNCNATKNDGHNDAQGNSQHNINLWQALSSGITGALIYTIFEVAPPGDETAAQKMNHSNKYNAMIAESVCLFALSVGTAGMEGLARSNLKLNPGFTDFLVRQTIMQVIQFFLQTEVQAGQITVDTLMAFKNAAQTLLQADYEKIGSEFQLFQTYIDSLTTQSSAQTASVNSLIKNSAQTYGSFLTALKDALNSQGQAVRSTVMA